MPGLVALNRARKSLGLGTVLDERDGDYSLFALLRKD
jgi:hypothetical protein